MTPTKPKASKATEAPLQAEQPADASLSWVERAKRAHLPQVPPPPASDATVAAVAAASPVKVKTTTSAAAGAMTPATDAGNYVAHLEAKISALQASITDLRSSVDTVRLHTPPLLMSPSNPGQGVVLGATSRREGNPLQLRIQSVSTRYLFC